MWCLEKLNISIASLVIDVQINIMKCVHCTPAYPYLKPHPSMALAKTTLP